MTSQVPRHDLSPAPGLKNMLQRVDDEAPRKADDLEEAPHMFDSVFGSALLRAYGHLMLDPAASRVETWEAVVAAMQVGSAMFAAATAPAGTVVECRIVRKVRRIPATGPQSFISPGNWLLAFWLAAICREQERMTQLANVPLEMLRASDRLTDEFMYHWVDALQTYWTKRPGLGEKLLTAFRLSHPNEARVLPRDVVLEILSAPIDIFYRFIRRDPEQINASLAQALELHRNYWTADEERAGDPEGAVALGPLGVACLAYDAGFRIDVESDYLPKYLLQRSWLGEFET